MLRHISYVCVLGIGLVLAPTLASPAQADPTLQFGAPGAWVKPLALPKTMPPASTGPMQILLENAQVNFADDGTTTYTEVAFRINTPQGLQAAMTVLSWNPDTDTATVHKVHIIRGDQIIDVLADGQTFSTMRRESNLEKSMLDGVLTAVLQPEDIQVGDILDYSVSVRHNDPVMQGNAEAVTANVFPIEVARLNFRAQWSKGRPMRWLASDDVTTAKLVKTAEGSEVSLNIDNFTPPKGPEQAPARFFNFAQIEYSEFGAWTDVSALMAPLYARAETLKDNSKLKAEADKIRAASSDPKQQAAAALHLVQNKVRYVFLGMNEGGYVPADADTTWARRFGDCKGKTVVLLALLHQLGIKAEPAMVSTAQGDGLDARLPVVEIFDHVMVRAEIAGKVYWLDGTRFGDRDIDSLVIPDFHWALPVRDKGASLEALKPAPLEVAQTETLLKLDATGGLDTPAPAHAERIFRGDSAVGLNTGLAVMQPAELDKKLRDYWKDQYSFIEIDTVSWSYDETTGDLRFLMDGKAKMDWDTVSSSRSRQYETDGFRVGWTEDFKRDGDGKKTTGDKTEPPVAVEYPSFVKTREIVLLPENAKGFTIKGDPVDQTLAGFAFKRTLAIKDGAFVMEVTTRAVTPEIPYKEAVAAIEPLKTLAKGDVYIKAPIDYQATAKDAQAATTATPKTAAEFIFHGLDVMQHGQFDQALADFNSALKLEPKNARAMAGRAYAKFNKKDVAGAKADIDAAAELDPQETLVYDGRGMIAVATADYPGALAAYSRALQINPDDLYALEGRAMTYMQMGDRANALKDVQAKLKADPNSLSALRMEVVIYAMDLKYDESLATLRKAIVLDPDDDTLHYSLASGLATCMAQNHKNCDAQRAEAVVEFGKVIAIHPTADAYASRAQARPYDDRDGRMADVDQAFRLDPQSPYAHLTRGLIYLNEKNYDKALEDFNAMLAVDAKNTRALLFRAQAYDSKGDYDHQVLDLQALIDIEPENAEWRNNLCWARATHDRDLEKGLAECNAAIKLSPLPNFYDSRGLIYLQMGRYDEAIADYNAILTARPDLPADLYPRGIAKLRKGLTKEGKADIDKARSLNSHIADRYDGYGVKP